MKSGLIIVPQQPDCSPSGIFIAEAVGENLCSFAFKKNQHPSLSLLTDPSPVLPITGLDGTAERLLTHFLCTPSQCEM